MLRFSVFLAAFLLTSVASATVRSGDRVLLMGDSEAFLLSQDFPAIVPRDITFKSVAFAGSSVISWSEKQPREWLQVFAFKPQVILVSLGANDACTGPSVVRNEGPFLNRFLTKLKRVGAREIVWVGPPKIGYPREDRRQCTASRAVPGLKLFAEMIQTTGVPYLDAREIEIDMWDDKLHCSRPQYPGDTHRGCLTWATWIWARVTTPENRTTSS